MLKFAVFFLLVNYPSIEAHNETLQQDLTDFIHLIPKDQLNVIHQKYARQKNVIKIINYLKTDEFHARIKTLRQIHVANNFIQNLESCGVFVIDFANELADLLGLPHYHDYNNTKLIQSVDDGLGWSDFLNELRNIIPVDKVKELKKEKWVGDNDCFVSLYGKVAIIDYQELYADVKKHPDVVNIVERLYSLGLDIMETWQVLKIVFDFEDVQ